ncbi:MAG: FAD-binding oxidoreductase [Pseudomonadota bacterium]
MAELMKDNAGYDVKQLFVGSEGTLGVATRMMVHLHPALAVRHSAMVAALDVRGLVALLRSARHWSGPRLTSFEASWREDEEHAVAATATRLPLEFDHGCYALLEAETSDGAGAGDRLEELPGSSLAAGAIEDAVIAQSLGESATLWRIRDTVAEVTGALTPWPHTTFRCPWSLWLHAGGLASRGGANPAVRVRGRPPMHRGRRRPRGFRPIRFEKSACLSDDSTAPFATPRSPGGRGGEVHQQSPPVKSALQNSWYRETLDALGVDFRLIARMLSFTRCNVPESSWIPTFSSRRSPVVVGHRGKSCVASCERMRSP